MGFLGTALGGIGGFLVGGPLGAVLGAGVGSGVDTNMANQDIASSQMRFQENMSNTAYQRAMIDMKAAGLNPILAYKTGGASTPSGSSIAMQNPFNGTAQTLDTMMNSAVSRKLATAQADKVFQENRKISNEADFLDLKKDEQKIINNTLDHTSRAQIEESKRQLEKEGTINEIAIPFWKKARNFIDEFPNTFINNFNSAMDTYFKGAK